MVGDGLSENQRWKGGRQQRWVWTELIRNGREAHRPGIEGSLETRQTQGELKTRLDN